ncbi:MAG: hypothetical protein FJ134_13090 [Deltaproteobacteria bacterium]|nr:hypothetical protein [Deltaproteobacteria bacterium]
MPFYLKHVPYAIWHVYLIETQDEDEALYEKDGEYQGYFDTESREDCELFGPFATREEALASDKARVEGR